MPKNGRPRNWAFCPCMPELSSLRRIFEKIWLHFLFINSTIFTRVSGASHPRARTHKISAAAFFFTRCSFDRAAETLWVRARRNWGSSLILEEKCFLSVLLGSSTGRCSYSITSSNSKLHFADLPVKNSRFQIVIRSQGPPKELKNEEKIGR